VAAPAVDNHDGAAFELPRFCVQCGSPVRSTLVLAGKFAAPATSTP
jgi:hypothetical protein